MKILFVSMPSIHVVRWIENLKDSGHELFWFDILDRGNLDTINSVHQFTNWKKRKTSHIKGEYFLSKKAPRFYQMIRSFIEVTANEALESIIRQIQPDVVHSFEMQSCSYTILKTMRKFSQLKWVYSCWGNDLFYYQNIKSHRTKIVEVLKRVNYLHTDCDRDYHLAKQLGFVGKHLGVIPGGTGYKIKELEIYKIPIKERKIILVKGYQHLLGRGLNVIKALEQIQSEMKDFDIVVFGAHQPAIDYIREKKLPFKVLDRHGLNHVELMQLMGKSLLYIGNSISDGMPNTLLEAIVMGAFPIQSNPGDVTAEIITDGENGFLINDPENIQSIQFLIQYVISDVNFLQKAYNLNNLIAHDRLEYNFNKNKIIKLYQEVLNN